MTGMARTLSLIALLFGVVVSTASALPGPSGRQVASEAQYGSTPGGNPVVPTVVPGVPTVVPGVPTVVPSPTATPDQNEVENENESGGDTPTTPDTGTDDNEVEDNTASGGGNGSTPTQSVESGSTASTGSLPFTGAEAGSVLLFGLLLLTAGLVLRRRTRTLQLPHQD